MFKLQAKPFGTRVERVLEAGEGGIREELNKINRSKLNFLSNSQKFNYY